MGTKTNDKSGWISGAKVITNKGTEDLIEKDGWVKSFDDYEGI